MKKQQFKKLAMLGLATGAIMASQSTVNALDANSQELLLAHNGCGGQGKCGGAKPVADNSDYMPYKQNRNPSMMNSQNRSTQSGSQETPWEQGQEPSDNYGQPNQPNQPNQPQMKSSGTNPSSNKQSSYNRNSCGGSNSCGGFKRG